MGGGRWELVGQCVDFGHIKLLRNAPAIKCGNGEFYYMAIQQFV